jgi:DNA-binding transcriptional LysR family regulator
LVQTERHDEESLAYACILDNNFIYDNLRQSIDLSDMTLRQLEILRALIRHRTTVAAADALHLSQPAVSNALKLMEDQAGFVLFERINNRLFPTPEALVLQADSEAIFVLHARLENRVRDLRESKGGHLRIAATPPLGHSVIPTALRRFLASRDVRVFLDVRRFEGVVDAVDSGLADIGFILGQDEHASLTRQELARDDMVCVMPQGHPLAALAEITPADLAAHDFIALERGTRMGEAVRRSFEAAAQAFNFTMEVRYCNTACALVEAGVGVAIVDAFSPVSGSARNLEIRRFRPRTPSTAFAIWSVHRPLARLAETFLGEVRRAMN